MTMMMKMMMTLVMIMIMTMITTMIMTIPITDVVQRGEPGGDLGRHGEAGQPRACQGHRTLQL